MTPRFLFYIFLSAITVFRLFYTGVVDLVADEAHFWLWSQNVNPLSPVHFGSYHPPMVAYFIWLSTFFGDSENAIRFTAVMGTAVVTLLVYHLANSIFDDPKAGLLSAVIANVTLIFSIGGLVITTDTPFVLFWTVMLFLGYKIVTTRNPKYWYFIGLVFGLALTSKFTSFLFPASIFLFFIFSPQDRFWLARKEPYLAFVIGLVIFSPVIIRNFTHDGGAFAFHAGRAFQEHSALSIKSALQFWGGQIGLYGGPLFFFIIFGAFGIGWLGLKKKRNDYLYLFFMSAPLFLFFFFNSFRSKMEGNWSAVAYISAVIATSGFMAYALNALAGKKRRILNTLYFGSITFAALAAVYAHAYIAEPSLPMPNNVKIAQRFYGWSQLGEVAGSKLKTMKPASFVLTDWYHTASLIHYYAPGRPQSYMIHSFGRFDYFKPGQFLNGRDALYVSEKDRLRLDWVKKLFQKIEPAGTLVIERKGKRIQEFLFFKCYNYKSETKLS